MEGWTFAAVALGVVLCFEFVLFRYATPERSTAGLGGASESPDSEGRNASEGPAAGRGARATGTDHDPASEHTVACERCGAVNADEPAVVFCRSCLGRLR